MWELLINSVTDKLRVTCTVLAFLVPYSVYKVNQKLHENGDPPWKKEEDPRE